MAANWTTRRGNARRFGGPHWKGDRGRCRWCDRKLAASRVEGAQPGYRGHGVFCSLECGYFAGMKWAGFDFVPKTPAPKE